LLPAGGIEIGIVGILKFGAGIERVERSEEATLLTMIMLFVAVMYDDEC
jgi:hypothetical protein